MGIAYLAAVLEEEGHRGNIMCLDPSKNRMKQFKHTINRLQISNIKTEILDITEDKLPMTNKMLLDVPCSGTGVMSKRADIRWRRSIDDILEMHLIQRRILWSSVKYIKPDGIIVYSTCSVEPEENWMVIDAFLKSHTDFRIEHAGDYVPDEYVDGNGAMYTYPPEHSIDGGYAVRLRKDA